MGGDKFTGRIFVWFSLFRSYFAEISRKKQKTVEKNLIFRTMTQADQ
jgi:hypothetical protein